MSKKFQICDCGDCEQAFMRAVEIAKKMEADDECPAFLMGIAVALQSTAASLFASAADTREEGLTQAAMMAAEVRNRSVGWGMENMPFLNDRIAEIIALHNAKLDQTDKLPRGL